MLRWTCRLRDALEHRAFLFQSSQTAVEELPEAEFVSSTNEGFPSEFRWDVFPQCTRTHSRNERMAGRSDLYRLVLDTPRCGRQLIVVVF
jgi:hypothetical protein